MKVIVCIDSQFGMMFNKRRQSKDAEVQKRVLSIIGHHPLYISEYSKSLFPDGIVVDDFSNVDGFAFIENPEHIIEEKVKEFYIFDWHRHYPADMRFDARLDDFKLNLHEEFVGNSHEEISFEHYIKG
jgi:hypothetical protein